MTNKQQSFLRKFLIMVLLAAALTPVMFALPWLFERTVIPAWATHFVFDLPLIVLGYSGYFVKRAKKYRRVVLSVFIFAFLLSVGLQRVAMQEMTKTPKVFALFTLEILIFIFGGAVVAKVKERWF